MNFEPQFTFGVIYDLVSRYFCMTLVYTSHSILQGFWFGFWEIFLFGWFRFFIFFSFDVLIFSFEKSPS